MFSFQDTDFFMSSQCHLLVNFKFTDTVHDHKRERSFCHLLSAYSKTILRWEPVS